MLVLITENSKVQITIYQRKFSISELFLFLSIYRRLPYQEKHVVQQASILGNMEAFGLIGKKIEVVRENANENSEGSDLLNGEEGAVPAVVEFGAGRGYLAQMLADCYGVKKLFLVERRSYKLKVSAFFLSAFLLKAIFFFLFAHTVSYSASKAYLVFAATYPVVCFTIWGFVL